MLLLQAYRKLSREYHPDRNKDANATEIMKLINKANEVLKGNESRPLYDQYLRKEIGYYTATKGEHFDLRGVPKTDTWIILLVVLLLISAFSYSVQKGNYDRAIAFLTKHTLAGTPISKNPRERESGTKQTLELHRRAVVAYEEAREKLISEGKSPKQGHQGKLKRHEDPLFKECVDKVVREVKIEGGCKKPELMDLFIIRFFLFPYTFFVWAKKYHRMYYSDAQLTREEEEQFAKETIGLGSWDEMSPEERKAAIDAKVWKNKELLEEADLIDSDDENGSLKPGFHRANKKLKFSNKKEKKQ